MTCRMAWSEEAERIGRRDKPGAFKQGVEVTFGVILSCWWFSSGCLPAAPFLILWEQCASVLPYETHSLPSKWLIRLSGGKTACVHQLQFVTTERTRVPPSLMATTTLSPSVLPNSPHRERPLTERTEAIREHGSHPQPKHRPQSEMG